MKSSVRVTTRIARERGIEQALEVAEGPSITAIHCRYVSADTERVREREHELAIACTQLEPSRSGTFDPRPDQRHVVLVLHAPIIATHDVRH